MEPDQPDVTDLARTRQYRPQADEPQVGEFRQGSALSRWGLARYLVGRAMIESVGVALLVVAAGLLALAVVSSWVVHSVPPAVVFVLLAAGVLLLRAIMLAIVRRLTALTGSGPRADRVRALVADTRGGVLRELRRIGLPGRTWTLPLLAFRLLGRERRTSTLARLRAFDVERAVPKARVDELHLLLRDGLSAGGPAGRDWQTGRHD